MEEKEAKEEQCDRGRSTRLTVRCPCPSPKHIGLVQRSLVFPLNLDRSFGIGDLLVLFVKKSAATERHVVVVSHCHGPSISPRNRQQHSQSKEKKKKSHFSGMWIENKTNK